MTGNGTTFALTSPSVTIGSVVSIGQGGQEIVAIEDDHLGTTGDHEYVGGDLRMNAPEVLTVVFNPDEVPVPSKTPSTATLTYPPAAGQSNGATKAGTAFIRRVDPSPIENDVRMLAEVEVHWDGKTGPTRTDGS